MATLLEFVELLGPSVVSVAVAPVGLDVPFAEAVLHDPSDPVPVGPGVLLLGIGLAGDAISITRRLQTKPTAIVLKQEQPLDDAVLAKAAAEGVAVLALAGGASWIGVAEVARALAADNADLGPGAAPGSSELVQDLFDVANAIAARVQAPITIEDNQSRLLAYSAQGDGADEARAATILGHRVPAAYREEVRRLGIAKRLLTEGAPIYFCPSIPGLSPRVVVALRAGGQVLGSIWAVTDEQFDEARTAFFAEAARSVSLRIWHHRAAADLQREQRARTLALVLAGGLTATEVGRRHGLESGAYRLLAASVGTGAHERRGLQSRVRDALAAVMSVTHPAGLVAEQGDVVYAVLPCPAAAAASGDEAREVTARLRARLDADVPGRVMVARSSHFPSLADMPQARDEVHAVLRVLAANGSARDDAQIEDVGLQVLLHRLADLQAEAPALRLASVAAIADHDARNGTDYLHTLDAHLWSFGDAAAAAARLNVHTNTFRYRLRRLAELFDLDLADADVRLSLMLQFRLARS